MSNPYTYQDFFSFFPLFFRRIFDLLTGTLSWSELASDEIQIFALIGIAISGGMVGSFLILRRMAMVANALSHTILLGIVLVYLFFKVLFHYDDLYYALSIPALLLAALLAGLLTVILTEFFTHKLKVQEDASVGLVFTTLFAIGIILVTLFTRNIHIGTELVMGNVDGIKRGDLHLVFIVVGLNLSLYFLFFKGLKITTFDPQLAKTLGFPPPVI